MSYTKIIFQEESFCVHSFQFGYIAISPVHPHSLSKLNAL